jgi:hypothetical protein
VNEEQEEVSLGGRDAFRAGLQWQPQLSKKRDFLPILLPRDASAIQPSSRRAREEDKDLPKTPLGSWEVTRNRPEPTGFGSSVTNFFPLPRPVWHTVSQGPTGARSR